MTINLKNLITKRQKALADDKESLFKMYRNIVNRERKLIRRSFYQEKVQHTKSKDPKKWSKQTNQICGMKKSSSSVPNPNNLTLKQLVDKINGTLDVIMQKYSPVLASDSRHTMITPSKCSLQQSIVNCLSCKLAKPPVRMISVLVSSNSTLRSLPTLFLQFSIAGGSYPKIQACQRF